MFHSTSILMPVTIRGVASRMQQQPVMLAPTRTDRRGISLLEILFSVFILSVGLLGLASLIPAGTTDVAAANVADRSGNIGRAAFREVSVRNFTDFNSWRNPMSSDDRVNSTGGTVPPFVQQAWLDIDDPSEPLKLSPVDEGHSICIDPMFIASSDAAWFAAGNSGGLLPQFDQSDSTWPTKTGWPGRAFPYFLDNDPKPSAANVANAPVVLQPEMTVSQTPLQMRTLAPPRMTRVTLRSWASDLAPTMGVGLADRIFRWHDDLLFDLPPDDALRPTATIDLLQRAQSEGDYTWMVTLTPVPGEDEADASERTLYNCSVIVFYKRNLSMPVPATAAHTVANDGFSWNLSDRGGQRPSERIVLADFMSSGISQGGGDVRLRLVVMNDATATNRDPDLPEQNDFTNIRPGNWIMLSGYLPVTGVFPNEKHHSVFQWFRVLAVGEGPTFLDGSTEQPTVSGFPEWIRDVTLVGPDWDPMLFVDVDVPPGAIPPSPPPPFIFRTCYATLVEGVVAVFSKTIPVE